MRQGRFYFRPDDYLNCFNGQCPPRPWVLVVQQKWRVAFLKRKLRFHNPYDAIRIPEYEEFATPKKR
jgi:hypothetical protein